MRSILLLLLALCSLLFALPALAITNSQALADAEAYIAQHRRGPATVKIAGRGCAQCVCESGDPRLGVRRD